VKHLVLLFFTFVLLSFVSCTIQKRLYRPGYHIEWRKKHRAGKEPTVSTDRPVPLSDDAVLIAPIVVSDTTLSIPASLDFPRDQEIKTIPDRKTLRTSTFRKTMSHSNRTVPVSARSGPVSGRILFWVNLVVLLFVTVLVCVAIVYLVLDGGWLLALLLLTLMVLLLIWLWPFR
jgi:hypothetical protein